MNYEEALRFIHGRDWTSCKPGLERIKELARRLGSPEKGLSVIHIAGSNGKGSAAAMLSSVLTMAGYKTGLYTSPHLARYNERFKINGKDITDERFISLAKEVEKAALGMEDSPTEFERCTAMAFLLFAKEHCDFAVVEVGLGGRLDATNIIERPILSVITHLALEHTEILGSSIEKIAFEKAGIIKKGRAVALYGQDKKAEEPVIKRAEELGSDITISDISKGKIMSESLEGMVFDYRKRKNVKLPLLGSYQYENAALVLDSLDILKSKGVAVPEEAIRQGLLNTVWPARLELIQKDPPVILDGAHNPDGVRALAKSLSALFPTKKFHFLMGVMKDKNYNEMIDIIKPLAMSFTAAGPDYYRALPKDELEKVLRSKFGSAVESVESVSEGVTRMKEVATKEHPAVIFGSLYQAGEARKALENK